MIEIKVTGQSDAEIAATIRTLADRLNSSVDPQAALQSIDPTTLLNVLRERLDPQGFVVIVKEAAGALTETPIRARKARQELNENGDAFPMNDAEPSPAGMPVDEMQDGESVDLETLKRDTLDRIRAAYKTHKDAIDDIIAEYGKGYLNFPSVPAEKFMAIAAALDRVLPKES
jgi:hypothetical protein